MPSGIHQWLDIGCYIAAFAIFIVGFRIARHAHAMRINIMSDRPNTRSSSPTIEPHRMRVVYAGYFGTHERLVKAEALLRWDERCQRGTLVGKRWWQPFNARWTGRSYLAHALVGLALIFALSLAAATLLMQ